MNTLLLNALSGALCKSKKVLSIEKQKLTFLAYSIMHFFALQYQFDVCLFDNNF